MVFDICVLLFSSKYSLVLNSSYFKCLVFDLFFFSFTKIVNTTSSVLSFTNLSQTGFVYISISLYVSFIFKSSKSFVIRSIKSPFLFPFSALQILFLSLYPCAHLICTLGISFFFFFINTYFTGKIPNSKGKKTLEDLVSYKNSLSH